MYPLRYNITSFIYRLYVFMTLFFIFNINMVCHTFPTRVLINKNILCPGYVSWHLVISYFYTLCMCGYDLCTQPCFVCFSLLMSILVLLAPPSSSMRVYENERVFQDLFRAHLGPFQRYIRLLWYYRRTTIMRHNISNTLISKFTILIWINRKLYIS